MHHMMAFVGSRVSIFMPKSVSIVVRVQAIAYINPAIGLRASLIVIALRSETEGAHALKAGDTIPA